MSPPPARTGSERLAAGLRSLGAVHAFGLPGTQNASLFVDLPRYGVHPVLATHEASAAFMANGYARVAGRPGVVLAIPGPGFAFALPGVAEARLDSVPLLLLTGAPARSGDGGRLLHQGIDQATMARPVVKGVVEVEGTGEVEAALARAWHLALAGEPGPVLVQVAPGVLGATAESPPPPGHASGPAASLQAPPHPASVEAARELVRGARRPLLFAGVGAAGAHGELREVAESWPAPVLTTLSGRGVLPEDHPLALGFDADRGRIGEMNELLDRADLIVAVGCKMSHNGTAGFNLRLPPERLLVINTDPEIGAAVPGARLVVRGGAGPVLASLAGALGEGGATSRWEAGEIDALRRTLRTPAPPRHPEPRVQEVDPPEARAVIEALRAALPRHGRVVTDSGLHQVVTRRYLDVLTPAGLLTPADLQSMGFGVPAALGAALADPGAPVVAVVGDGGFLMTVSDLVCAAREDVPLPVVVFNDGHLNLIRLQQIRDSGTTGSVELHTPHLATLADALGVGYLRVGSDPRGTLEEALSRPGPTLVEVVLGDSREIRRVRRSARGRAVVRRALGPRVIARIKRLLGR